MLVNLTGNNWADLEEIYMVLQDEEGGLKIYFKCGDGKNVLNISSKDKNHVFDTLKGFSNRENIIRDNKRR